MRKFVLFISLLTVLTGGLLIAQIPQVISYQGYLTDTEEDPVADGTYTITFRIFNVETGGATLWYENQNVGVTNGLYSVYLGEVTSLDLPFDTPYWLEVEFDGTVLSPRYQLASLPYALNAINAATAGTAGEVAWSDITGTPSDISDGDDYMAGEVAGGDLEGTYPNPEVVGLQGYPIAAAIPASGQVLKFDGSYWAPGTDLTGGAGGTLNDLTDVNAPLPAVGEVIKWNGSEWANAPDATGGGEVGSLSDVLGVGNSAGVYNINMNGNGILNIDWASSNDGAGSGLDADYLDGNESGYYLDWDNFTDIPGDISDGDDYMSGETAGGDLAGTYPNPTIAPRSAGDGQVLKWNSGLSRWMPSNDLVGGAAGALDDLTDVNAPSPGVGEVIKWNGSEWANAPDEGGSSGDSDWLFASGSDVTGDIYHMGIVGVGVDDPAHLFEVQDTGSNGHLEGAVHIYSNNLNFSTALVAIGNNDGTPYSPFDYTFGALGGYSNGPWVSNRNFGAWGHYYDPAGGVGGYGVVGSFGEDPLSPDTWGYIGGSDYAGYFMGNGYFSGALGIGTETPSVPLEVYGTDDIGPISDGIVNIGEQASWHVTLDNNEIHGRYGADPSNLYINDFGGTVYIANNLVVPYGAIGEVALTGSGILSLIETTSPPPSTSFGKLYVKSADSHLYFKDEIGTEYDLLAGGGGSDNDWLYFSGSGVSGDIYHSGNGAMGSVTDPEGYGLYVQNYENAKAAVRGTDQNGANIYAEGQLGVYVPDYLPYNPTNIGVLGIKPNIGSEGVGVYGWNYGNNEENYAMYAICDGFGANNYGIYAEATNGSSSNYAGYFVGDGYYSGIVGIGTEPVTDLRKLDVQTNSGIAYFGQNNDDDYATLYLQNLGVGPSARFQRGDVVVVSGDVGIGTVDPSEKLHVDGNLLVTQSAAIGTTVVPGYGLHVLKEVSGGPAGGAVFEIRGSGPGSEAIGVSCVANTDATSNGDAFGVLAIAEVRALGNTAYGGYFLGDYPVCGFQLGYNESDWLAFKPGGLFGGANGVGGMTTEPGGFGVYGQSIGGMAGVNGACYDVENAYGVRGYANGSEISYGVLGLTGALAPTSWAGYFIGDVNVNGSLTKGSGSFLIDHPLDPLNKTLRHNFVESPENLCLYRGKVELNSEGKGTVEMPTYFKALTREDEASINLTPVGRPFLTGAEWKAGFTSFTVYGEPNREVYYTVYADRDDPVMHELYRPVEEEKGPGNFVKGKLMYPAAYGYPEEMGVDYEAIHTKQDLLQRGSSK